VQSAAPTGLQLFQDLHRLQQTRNFVQAAALRIRAHAGNGVALLPKIVMAQDIENRVLVQTGYPDWTVPRQNRLYRSLRHTNRMTNPIRSDLKVPQDVPLEPAP